MVPPKTGLFYHKVSEHSPTDQAAQLAKNVESWTFFHPLPLPDVLHSPSLLSLCNKLRSLTIGELLIVSLWVSLRLERINSSTASKGLETFLKVCLRQDVVFVVESLIILSVSP